MKKFKKIKLISLFFSLYFFYFLILTMSLRGLPGNPTATQLNNSGWKENGPFELSPERGRFALLYSIIENRSFQFSDNLGKFATPDVAVSKGKYVSLFAPLLSFAVIPGYIIGKFFGASQVGTFAVISVFALLNMILLRSIAIRLGANKTASTIASILFLFATPAYSYAVNLYQHHVSTFLILLSLYALLKSEKILSLLLVFFLFALAIPLDYPNLFFMFPLVVFAIGKIISFESVRNKMSIKVNIFRILTPIVMVIPILFFLWFNHNSYGNPFQLSGTLQSIKSLEKSTDVVELSTSQGNKTENAVKKSAVRFFQTRNILNGLYTHFIGPDRGIIYYTPVILFGAIGFFLAFKKRVKMVPLLAATIGANILLYSMWGDPWGGWAFGSRYLIPTYAILSIFIALLLTYWRKKYIFLTLFVLVALYSIAVNTLGAITTSAMPPKVEVLNLEKLSGIEQKYTYERNWDFLLRGNSKSFVFQTFAKNYVTSAQYYQIIVFMISASLAGLMLYFILSERKSDNV